MRLCSRIAPSVELRATSDCRLASRSRNARRSASNSDGVALDVVQHRSQRGRRVVAGRDAGVEQRLHLVDVLAIGVEDRLAHLVGGGALHVGLLLLVGEQHDDLAMRGEHLLQLRDDLAGRGARGAGGGAGRDGGGRRLLAAARQREAGGDRESEGRNGGGKARAHRLEWRRADPPRRPRGGIAAR